MFSLLVTGITEVSIKGASVKEKVTLDTNGGSGAVTILNRTFPTNLVSSPRTSTAALTLVLKRIDTPGGVT
jgi:hypothetical protein